MKKRLLALLLAAFMAASLLPMTALAAEQEEPAEPVAVEETVPAELPKEEEEPAPGPDAAPAEAAGPVEAEAPAPAGAEPAADDPAPAEDGGDAEPAGEPAPDAKVWMTVSNEGTLALARASVTVRDLDADGTLTFDEALKAAHEAYCPGGYEGVWYSDAEYGDYYAVNRLWNVENGGAYMFYVNDVLGASVEAQPVAAGDDLAVAVMKDTVYYSDIYSYFTAKTVSAEAGEEIEFTLKADSYNSGTLAGAGLTAGTWSDGAFTPLEGKVTDAEGRVRLSFDEPGTYVVSAAGTLTDEVTVDWVTGETKTLDCTVTAPVCVVTVEAAEVAIPADADAGGDISATASDRVLWWIKNGTLTIAGEGAMSNITSANAKKHDIYLNRDKFTKVVVKEGVTSIGNYRLSNLDFTEISLPASLTAIGSNALYMSKLFTSLTVPASVTGIGNSAFSGCSALRAVTLPAALKTIGNSVFSNDGELLSVTIPGSVTSMGNSVFSGCEKLASVAFEDGEEGLSMGGSVFTRCKAMTSFTFPDRTVAAGTSLFEYCDNLKTITISAGASGLAHGGISGGTLDSAPETATIVVDPASTHYRDTESGIIYIIDGDSTTGILLVRKTVSGDIVIPEGVTEIDTNAFAARREITSVTLPGTLKTIGDMAFQNCDKLASINLPEGLISFGHSAFAYSGLKAVTLPSTLELTSASHSAFSNCASLETVTILTGNLLPTQTFQNCTALKTVNLGAAVTEIDGYIYQGSEAITTVTLDPANTAFALTDGVVYTKDGRTLVFCPNGRTEDLVIPEGTVEIGTAAFYYTTKISKVNFPSTLEKIGEDAFCDAQSLTKAILPDSCVTIEPYAFQNCYALNEIRLGSGVTELPTCFAQYCEALEAIVIPEGVTAIGDRAFQNAKSLTSVNMPAALKTVGANAFQNCPIAGDLVFPEGLTDIGGSAFYGCEYVADIYLPSTLVSLGNQWAYGMIAHHIYFPGSDTQWTAVNKKNTAAYPATTEIILFYGAEADAPVIAVQPESVGVPTGSDVTLSVTMAPPPEGKTLTVTWYSNTAKTTTSGGKAVATAVSEDGLTATCAPATATPGGTFYYAVAYLTDADGTVSKPAYTDIVTVAVLIDGFTGKGMEEDPYVLAGTDDVVRLRDRVNEGMEMSGLYFKMTEDITLPTEWVPIGKTKDGSNNINSGRNLYAFRGVFDGGGHTVTVPAGEKPLFAYVRGAEIRNLNVYGERIEGYGLINNMEGVGLSGTAVIVENVTIKAGTKTLKSGITGGEITTNGFAGVSMSYETTIRNCTVEKGVVIGYDGSVTTIGSFAGRLQGTVENCVSYATVKGNGNVGGIIGTRDNAMGNCSVNNCEFHGTIEASGEFVGGIAGQNYTNCTAPNGITVLINGCTVTGDITGGNNVGGIFGGDQFTFQPWGDCPIRNNHFSGHVAATAKAGDVHVGGIVGYMACLNAHTLFEDNTFTAGCGADTGWGYVKSVDTSAEKYATEDGSAYGWSDGTFYYDSSKGVEEADAAVRVPENGGNKVVSKMDQQRADDPLGADADALWKMVVPEHVLAVTVSVLGDVEHDCEEDGQVHGLASGGLVTWLEPKTFYVDDGSTVWDALTAAFEYAGIECHHRYTQNYGSEYIYALTYEGLYLAEKGNGPNSGWMFALNGKNSDLGVSLVRVADGDEIVFYYTDDYTKEDYGGQFDPDEDVFAVEDLIDDIGEVTADSREAIEAARAAYDALTDAQKALVSNYDKLLAAEAALQDILVPGPFDYDGDDLKFVKEDGVTAFGMYTAQPGTKVELSEDGESIRITFYPKNVTTYKGMYLDATIGDESTWKEENFLTPAETEAGIYGVYTFTLSKDMCGRMIAVAPVKAKDGATTSAQYYLAIPAESKLPYYVGADDAQVYVTISNAGVLALARAAVTVEDIDKDGALTYDEALVAAHKAYCPAGAEGYSTSGTMVRTLWGVDTGGSCMFVLNDAFIKNGVTTDTVKADDDLVAAIMSDTEVYFYTDYHSYYTEKEKTVAAGESFDLTLVLVPDDMMGLGETSPAGLQAGTWADGKFTAIEGAVADAAGKVTLNFAEPGTYVVSAAGTVEYAEWGMTCPIFAPVCIVTVEGVPAFKSQSLILSGEIGMNFYLDLSQLTEDQRAESCVEFTVGKAAPVQVAFDANKTNSKGYFGFTCYVKSIQMADTITAVYHYGDGKTISKEYSVVKYIQAVEKNASGYNAKTLALVRSIADFGHYAQIYLAEVNGWTIGEHYTEMALHFADTYNYADILSRVQANAFVKAIDGTNITKATYKLHLDAETTVDVYLTTKDGKAPTNVTLTIREEESGKETTKKVTPVKQSDGRYLIRISGISAHKLGDMMTITGTAGKKFTVQVSALSYVRSVLNNAGSTEAAKNCMAALYRYYEATMAYRKK